MTAARHLVACALVAVLVPIAAWADEAPKPKISIQEQATRELAAQMGYGQAPRGGGVRGAAPRINSLKPIWIGAAVGAGLGALLGSMGGDGTTPQSVVGWSALTAGLGGAVGFAISLR